MFRVFYLWEVFGFLESYCFHGWVDALVCFYSCCAVILGFAFHNIKAVVDLLECTGDVDVHVFCYFVCIYILGIAATLVCSLIISILQITQWMEWVKGKVLDEFIIDGCSGYDHMVNQCSKYRDFQTLAEKFVSLRRHLFQGSRIDRIDHHDLVEQFSFVAACHDDEGT